MALMLRITNDVGEPLMLHPESSRIPPVLLGVGNTLLADDGVGVRIMEQLRGDPAAGGFVLLDGGTLSFSLLTYLEGTPALVAVDAANMQEAAGTVRMFENDAMDRFVRRARGRSVHEIGLADLLDMALLHGCLPARRALVCVQPLIIDWGEELSPAVSAALPRAVSMIRALLRRWPA